MQADIVFRNATVIDGTGAPRFTSSVAVRDDRIVAVGTLEEWSGGTEHDCTGFVLAPGFIDPHVHHDEIVLTDPDMACMTSQGVTSIINGNCGFSIAPLTARGSLPAPLGLILTAQAPRFASYGDYRRRLDDAPPAVNAACLIGHGTLRINEVADLGRAADAAELAAMRKSLDDALSQGGAGLSTGTFYPPARAAPTAELIAMAEVAQAHGKLYVTHMRDEGDRVVEALEETFEIGRKACCGVHVSHHKCAGLANHGLSETTLGMIDAARLHQDVGLDTTPWIASSTMLNSGRHRQATRVIVADSETHPEHSGRDLADIAQDWGVDLDTAVERLLPAAGIFFVMDEGDVRRILTYPETIVCSDGIARGKHPHPRVWGTFPRVLGHYVRDVGLFPLETAVQRMTSMPADRFGLTGRGRIAEGQFADLVLFDADRIAEAATFESPVAPAHGIHGTWVNGRKVWSDGAPTGARPGRTL
ncbi:D-aminoacylase [Roseibacterium beibuensis]|uniref:D-aminoacylase n=1 Tax=[Roseibacterium] beibuensis TaxID=1193142 RepID=A0ABP9LFQ2_9RHOB|nr:D-aminoacylase [Roseibacterium beibuensis]MCS6623287.1 D-aminoacylase [Roseibacterium beibuensis]